MLLIPNAACRVSAGSGMSSAYSALPLTCRWALSWRVDITSGRRRDRCGGPGWISRSAIFEIEPAQQVTGRLLTIGAARPHVCQRLEILCQLRDSGVDARLVPDGAQQRAFGRARS